MPDAPRHSPAGAPAGAPLWLCAHLPELPLAAVAPLGLRTDALGALAPPLLVWQASPHGQQVHQANAAARALGVQAGQRLSLAQALAPQALVQARDPDREAGCLVRLAQTLGSLTPTLLIEHGDVLLDIHASLRLFGGVRRLLQRARKLAATQPLGRVAWGLASTPLGARLLARQPRRCLRPAHTRRALQGLPLTLLGEVAGLPEPPLQLLHTLGARTLADLADLPRTGLSRRGAAAWLDALDRATGQRPDPKRWWCAPEHFDHRIELGHRVDHAPALEAALAPLLHALAGWLRLRWLAATRLSLHLQPEHGARRHLPPQELVLHLATPTREAAHLHTLLRERLHHTTLAAPVDALRLRLDQAVPTAGRPATLLPDHPDTTSQATTEAELADRLRARLGPHSVHRLALRPDPRPEKADQPLPPEAPCPRLPPDPLQPLRPRPAWLLQPARPLEARHDQPWLDGQPLHLLPGTERIEFGWHDGWLVRRDYHVARSADGALHWLYRDRAGPGGASGSIDEPVQWFLQGHF